MQWTGCCRCSSAAVAPEPSAVWLDELPSLDLSEAMELVGLSQADLSDSSGITPERVAQLLEGDDARAVEGMRIRMVIRRFWDRGIGGQGQRDARDALRDHADARADLALAMTRGDEVAFGRFQATCGRLLAAGQRAVASAKFARLADLVPGGR